jgi:hypothetical protein
MRIYWFPHQKGNLGSSGATCTFSQALAVRFAFPQMETTPFTFSIFSVFYAARMAITVSAAKDAVTTSLP